MKTVVLHGELADHLPAKYEGKFTGDFTTAADAASMLECNFPGFFDLIADKHLHVIPKGNEEALNEEQCLMYQIGAEELHIMPAIEGAGGGKGLLAVLGIALIAVAVVVTGGAAIGLAGTFGGGVAGFGAGTFGASLAGWALNMGIGLTLNALVQPPKPPGTAGADQDDNGIYTGPLNVFEEGAALPIVLGTIEVGGVVIHTDYDVVTIKNDDYEDD